MKKHSPKFLRNISVSEIRAAGLWKHSFSCSAWERLDELLGPASKEWRVELSYEQHDRWPVICGSLHGILQPVCQRCLDQMKLPLILRFSWALAVEEDEFQQLPANLAPVQLCGNGLALRDALEDEVLLSMPSVYRHPVGQCTAPEYETLASPVPETKNLISNEGVS